MFMIKNILQNVFKRPATRLYPTVKREPFERYRGRLLNNIEECIFCRLCSSKCPSQCIATDPKEAYWGYDPFSCVYCGLCVDICPTKSLFMLSTYREPVPTKFVVYNKGVPRASRPKHSINVQPPRADAHAEMPPPQTMPAVGASQEPEIARITAKAQRKTQEAKPKTEQSSPQQTPDEGVPANAHNDALKLTPTDIIEKVPASTIASTLPETPHNADDSAKTTR